MKITTIEKKIKELKEAMEAKGFGSCSTSDYVELDRLENLLRKKVGAK